MKLTREEILAAAHKATNDIGYELLNDEELERFALAMYQRGQEDMRERAAVVIHELPLSTWLNLPQIAAENIIRALPIGDE